MENILESKVEVVFCSKCGTKFEDNAKFCANCGSIGSSPSITSEQSTEKDNQTEILEKKPIGDINNPNSGWFGCLGCLGIIFLFIVLVVSCTDDSTPSRDPNSMTNKEMQDFLKWKDKKSKKEWENKKFGE